MTEEMSREMGADMGTVRTHEFETHRPVELVVETQKGAVRVTATEITQTLVRITGADAREVLVEQDEERIEVIGPRRRTGFFGGNDSALHVEVEVPVGSSTAVRTGSADVALAGPLHTVQVRTGSGDVVVERTDGPALLETGSGDLRLAEVLGELRVKTGSGDVHVDRAASAVVISSGSGDVTVGSTDGPAVVKTGSGSLRIRESGDDVTLTTGSGDLAVGAARRGRLSSKGASGDVRVGIPPGVPVWTDISTLTGTIRSEVRGTGQPVEGADHVELRATTVSGDIVLVEA